MSSSKNRFVIGSGLLILLVVIGVGAWSLIDVLPGRKNFSMTDQADAVGSTQLSIDSANAGVSLSPSKDSEVHVSASGKYTDSTPKVSLTKSGGTVSVSESCSSDCEVQLTVSLPAKLAVKVSSGDSWTTAQGLAGSLDIATRSGAIDLTDSSGPLTLNSTNGQIKVAGATSDTFSATATDGEVRAAFRTPPTTANVKTNNGGIDLTLPNSDYYIQADSANSTPQIGLPVDRNAKHTVMVKSNNGGINIHR